MCGPRMRGGVLRESAGNPCRSRNTVCFCRAIRNTMRSSPDSSPGLSHFHNESLQNPGQQTTACRRVRDSSRNMPECFQIYAGASLGWMHKVASSSFTWAVHTLRSLSYSDICRISSGRAFMINTRDQRNLLHTWIILVTVKHHMVHIGRIDGPTEYSS